MKAKSVFLLDPRHKSRKVYWALQKNEKISLLFIPIVSTIWASGLSLLIFLYRPLLDGRFHLVVGFLLSAFLILTTLALLPRYAKSIYQAWKKAKKLEETGILLEGEIASCFIDNWHGFTLYYTFRNPSGRFLRASAYKTRFDLNRKTLPQAGTPVNILYADDDCHMLL